MIAAIYARKSTEQSGVPDEQRSVARQIEHAAAYARRKGWSVDAASVFVDDGISGAEFANRPGYLRLLNALKQLVQGGVRVFSTWRMASGRSTPQQTRSCCRSPRLPTNWNARRAGNGPTTPRSARPALGMSRAVECSGTTTSKCSAPMDAVARSASDQ